MSSPPPPKKPVGRKLLVAAIGVATVSYVVACGGKTDDDTQGTKADSGVNDAGPDVSSGNLVPPPDDTMAPDTLGPDISSGNLVPPPDSMDDDTGAPDTSAEDTLTPDISSGNLVPPPDGSDL